MVGSSGARFCSGLSGMLGLLVVGDERPVQALPLLGSSSVS